MVRTLAAVLAVHLLLAGCAGSGPTMSGFAIGDYRTVKVNEIVEVRLPLRPNGSRQWQVNSFDSLYLVPVGQDVASDAQGSVYQLVRARAKTPGETSVEVVEVLSLSERGRREPKRRVFKVRILE